MVVVVGLVLLLSLLLAPAGPLPAETGEECRRCSSWTRRTAPPVPAPVGAGRCSGARSDFTRQHVNSEQQQHRSPGRAPGGAVLVPARLLPGAPAEDGPTAAAPGELQRRRRREQDRGLGPAAGGRRRRRPAGDPRPPCAVPPDPDLPGREGVPEGGRRGPARGALLAHPVPESLGGARAGVRGPGGDLRKLRFYWSASSACGEPVVTRRGEHGCCTSYYTAMTSDEEEMLKRTVMI